MGFPGHFRIPGHSGTDQKHKKPFTLVLEHYCAKNERYCDEAAEQRKFLNEMGWGTAPDEGRYAPEGRHLPLATRRFATRSAEASTGPFAPLSFPLHLRPRPKTSSNHDIK